MRTNSFRLITGLVFAALLSGCASYYGYMPGSEYPIYKNTEPTDLHGKYFTFTFKDSRDKNSAFHCYKETVDRHTELEGPPGQQLVQEYVLQTVPAKNGQIIANGMPVEVDLQAIAYHASGTANITLHGLVQLKVSAGNAVRTYCVNQTDGDPDSPLHWYLFDSRQDKSRKLASAAVRKAVGEMLKDLAK